MNVRRVVTGHDAHGKAVIVDDGVVEPTTVALSAHCLPRTLASRLTADPSRRRH